MLLIWILKEIPYRSTSDSKRMIMTRKLMWDKLNLWTENSRDIKKYAKD